MRTRFERGRKDASRRRERSRWRSLATLWLAGLTVTMAIVSTSCGDNPTGPSFPSDSPFVTGRVTALTAANAGAVTIRVEANPAVTAAPSPKVLAYVDDITLVRLPGNVESTYRSLAIGQWVRIWMEGAVSDSYPPQGTARAIAIDTASAVLK